MEPLTHQQIISLARPDWESRIRAGLSLIPDGLPLDRVEFERAVTIWNKLRLPDVVDEPRLEEAGGGWFREIVGTTFGAIRHDGERFIREVFLLVAKKNNKTTGGAAMMLTALLMNRRPRAEFLFVGPTKLVSELAFSQAAGMIDLDPFLKKRMQVTEHLKTITDLRTKAKLMIKTFDTSVLTGVKPAGALIDELHEISSDSNADRVIGQLRGGLMANPEGFLIFITTQSERPPAGVFKAELEKARGIRDGIITGVPMLPVLYEFPHAIAQQPRGNQPALWRDQQLWWMVTPNMGRSVTLPRLVEGYNGAVAGGEGELRRWASQHLNVQIGMTMLADAWPGAMYWEAAADKTLTFETLLQRSEVVTIGIDGGGMDDFLALCVMGREKETKRWLAWHHSWMHSGVLELRKSEAPRFLDFQAAGELTIVNSLDEAYDELADYCARVEDAGKLAEKNAVGLDPMGVSLIVDALASVKIEGSTRVVGVAQSYRLQGIVSGVPVKLQTGALVHAGHATTAWAAGNAKIETKGNAILVTKQASGRCKVDPLMATFDAAKLMESNPVAARKPQYQLVIA